MDVLSSSETTEARFALYAKELQEFFASHKLQFGSPHNVVALAETLGTHDLVREEMSSMIRSILYRETGNVPRTQMLDLIVTTIGGADVDSSAQEFHEPIRKIFDFIGGVVRPPRRPIADEQPNPEVPQAGGRSDGDAISPSGVQSTIPSDLASADLAEPFASPYSNPASLTESAPRLDPGPQLVVIPDSKPASQVQPLSNLRASEPSRRIKPTKPDSGTSPVDKSRSSVRTFAASIPLPRPPSLRSPGSGMPNQWMLCLGLLLFVLIAAFVFHHLTSGSEEKAGQRPPNSAQPIVSPSTRPASAAPRSYPSKSESSRPHNAFSPLPRKPEEPPVERTDSEESGSVLAGQSSNHSLSSTAESTELLGDGTSQAAPVKPVESSTYNTQPYSSTPSIPNATINTAKSRTTGRSRATTYKGHGTSTVSSGVMANNLISAPAPDYPRIASLTHIQGQVVLQVVVSRNGSVIDTRILSGHRILRGAASKAVRRWRYRPYLIQGRPTDVATIVTVDFRLPR